MLGAEILRLTDVTKSYSGVVVLDNVEFKLHEGEVHCIIGENGAGKSTLIKILSGAIHADHGEIVLCGKKCTSVTPLTQINDGIATIYQDIDLVDTLTVADNIFLGHEKNSVGFIKREEQEKVVQKLLDDLSVHISASALVGSLSTANKQMVQLAKALHYNAKIVIMDEPTASLGEEESRQLMDIVRKLSAEKIGIIYISHYLEEVFEVATTITVIKDGRVTGVHNAKDVTPEEIVAEMVGRGASLYYSRKPAEIGEEVLRVEHLDKEPVVKDVSFSVRKGEILGFGGLVGSGRSEIMEMLFGVMKKRSGRVYLHGKELNAHSPKQAISSGICMLSEDRKGAGLFMDRSILENMCVVRNEKRFFVSPRRDKASSNEMIHRFSLKANNEKQLVRRLSGGNQQKAIIARWMLTDFDVIIFDEPTKGVDIGARAEIYDLMVELAQQGKAIIMVSSDMPELLSLSDRIVVVVEGRVVDIVENKDITEEDLMKKYLNIA